MISKKILMPMIAIPTIIGIGALSVRQVHAETNSKGMSGLESMIAQKFNLDQRQVQAVVDQYRAGLEHDRLLASGQRVRDWLGKLVKDGKISQSQMDAILSELNTLDGKYPPSRFEGLSVKDRISLSRSEQDELASWAKTHNIDPQYLRPGFGRHFIFKNR